MDNTKERAEESILHNAAITLPMQKDTFVYSSKKEDAGIYSPKGYGQYKEFAKNPSELSDKEQKEAHRIANSWKNFEKAQEMALSDRTYIDTTRNANMETTNFVVEKRSHPYEKEHMELLQNFMVEEREAYRQQMNNERMIREFVKKVQEEKE